MILESVYTEEILDLGSKIWSVPRLQKSKTKQVTDDLGMCFIWFWGEELCLLCLNQDLNL